MATVYTQGRTYIIFNLKGEKELLDRLEKIGKKAQTTVLKKAAAEGGDILVREMRNRVPVDSGFEKEWINRTKPRMRKGFATVGVGPAPGILHPHKMNVNPVLKHIQNMLGITIRAKKVAVFFWVRTLAHFLEFGTKKMPARPFMRPAMAACETEVMDKFAEVINEELIQRGV